MNRHYESPIIVLGKEGDGASADPTTVGATFNRLKISFTIRFSGNYCMFV